MKFRYKASGIATRVMFPLCAALLMAPAIRAAEPSFEQVSVKPAQQCLMQNSIDAGRISLNGVPLKTVLMEAFEVKAYQIVAPAWLESECFTVNATLPPGASREQIPAMLRGLLAERFGFEFHRENRLRAGYVLMVDKGGSKLTTSDPAAVERSGRSGQVRFGVDPARGMIEGAMTAPTLARLLSNRLATPVEDATELSGVYDVALSWTPDRGLENVGGALLRGTPASASDPTGGPDIFTALRESLGLRLEGRKEQVETIVVERVSRVPSAN